MDDRYQTSNILVKRIVEQSAAEEMLKTMYYCAKTSLAVLQWGTVEHDIGKRSFPLPNNCVGDQVATTYFGIIKQGNEVYQLRIECRVGIGQEDVSG